ncbi:hypothetical protein [Candidatus Phyllobacterium onerii]|uniref:hypothetical protein n=1 Tax=Candidatus Phyllobacterium onerii TaxID=3020828 RepID=UPI00232FFD92|nr:hypothetical protein [Phyllobacterium sp. IY22]
MFTFTGYLNQRRFAYAAGLRIGLFVASILAFPFALYGLKFLTNCRSVDGTCGAVGLVGAMAFKPLVAYLFVLSFLGISLRRSRDAGLPAWIGLAIPLLLAADLNNLIVIGAPWSLAFSQGIGTSWPRFAVQALACIFILCLLPSREPTSGTSFPFGNAGKMAFALGLYISFFNVLSVLSGNRALDPYMRPIWMMMPRPASKCRTKKIWSAIIVSFVAYALMVETGPLLLISLPVNLTTILLPTFLLYLALIWTIVRSTKARTIGSFLLVALAASPFLHWGYSRWVVSQAEVREAAEIKAIPTIAPGFVPPVLVVESQESVGPVWAVPQIQRVIWKDGYPEKFRQLERSKRQSFYPAAVIDGVPDTYLLLKRGRSSSFAKPKQQYASDGGPYELRIVAPGRNDLIAVSYKTFNPRPSLLPVLTQTGWYRGSNNVMYETVSDSVKDFLLNSLRGQ